MKIIFQRFISAERYHKLLVSCSETVASFQPNIIDEQADITIDFGALPYRMLIISNYFPITAYRVEGQNNYFRYTKTQKRCFLQIWHVPKFQECVFSGNKKPLRGGS